MKFLKKKISLMQYPPKVLDLRVPWQDIIIDLVCSGTNIPISSFSCSLLYCSLLECTVKI